MVLLPAALQLAGVVVIVGTAGVVSCAALLKAALAADVQLPFPAVTV